MLIGTVVNTLAIMAGSSAGLLLDWFSRRFSKNTDRAGILGARLQETIMHGMALCVLYIGISGSLTQGGNTLMSVVSIACGGIVGELLNLNEKMERLGNLLQEQGRRFGHGSNISEGFVTATLLFCVGAMAIVGPLQDGLSGNHATLFAKSLVDGVCAVVFASTLGVGVLFSALTVFVYQGVIALLASFLSPFLGDAVIAQMTCVGSLLIIGVSLNMLGITKMRIMNLLPACFFPIILCPLWPF